MSPLSGGTLTSLGAEVSTANATWWLLVATLLGAAGATFVVWSAFAVQNRQFRRETLATADLRQSHNVDALAAIAATLVFLKGACDRHSSDYLLSWEVWDDISRCNEHRVVLDYFARSELTALTTRFRLASTLQRVAETEAGLKRFLPGENGTTSKRDRDEGIGTLRDVVRRIDETPGASVVSP